MARGVDQTLESALSPGNDHDGKEGYGSMVHPRSRYRYGENDHVIESDARKCPPIVNSTKHPQINVSAPNDLTELCLGNHAYVPFSASRSPDGDRVRISAWG